MSPGLLLVMRALHIVVGALWAGAIVTVAMFLMPSILAAGPAGGAVMRQVVEVRKLPVFMMAVGALTLLSGLALFWFDAHGNEAFVHSPFGRAISVGAALAIVAMVAGMAMNAPTAKRLAALAGEAQKKGGAPDAATAAEMLRLQQKMLVVTRLAAALIVLAVIAMASARYL
jgi:hypothetical protein